MQELRSNEQTFVLSGGGLKCAFQAGAIKELERQGIKAAKLYGSSAGALNAAFLSYNTPHDLYAFYESVQKKSDFLDTNRFSFLVKDGYYNMKPLQKKMDGFLVGQPHTEAVVSTVDLITGKIEYTSNMEVTLDEFKRRTRASGSIPGAIESVDHLVDGAVRDYAPLKQAIRDGHRHIVLVICSTTRMGKWEPKKPGIAFNALRAIDIQGHEIMMNDIEETWARNKDGRFAKVYLTVIKPDRKILSGLEFDNAKIRETLKHGEEQVATGKGFLQEGEKVPR